MHSTPPEPPDDKAVIELISPDRLNPYLTACGGDTTPGPATRRQEHPGHPTRKDHH
ncbi:hypothetical protein [Streptomyces sp. NPDC058394]|uniref:hypothetical protein n=1 Tax=Streptomyces sp. NPDC058394 TaxID=3346477 RepID=UPI003646E388